MYILGISCFYHDSAIALIKNGEIISCIQEERLTRIKNDSNFPQMSLNYLCEEFSLNDDNLSDVVFYDKPFLKFERITETIIQHAPYSFSSALTALPSWLTGKINTKKLIIKELGKFNLKNINIRFSEHHFSHAAASFYTSPFKESCVITIDGVGEWATSTISNFDQDSFETVREMHFPNSVGILYSSFTFFCGFKINSGEYKLMGLAPYGNPNSQETKNYIDIIKSKIVKIHSCGSIKLNLDYFKFHIHNETINLEKFEEVFALKRRVETEPISQDYCDIALAIQTVTEEIILKQVYTAEKLTTSKNLCLAGGVALNCVANSKILSKSKFQNFWIHPNPGDAGAALGAALGFFYKDKLYQPSPNFNPYLGPYYSAKEIKSALRSKNLPWKEYNYQELNKIISSKLVEDKVIGWFQDSMEWGPRALGNRSILANPKTAQMQGDLNLKIKFREGFRPFAPVVLEEKAANYFNTQSFLSPFMQYTFSVYNSNTNQDYSKSIDERLKSIDSPIPAVTHVNHTARLQTVNRTQNQKLYDLIVQFEQLTGTPVLINTSFNVRGEPIVCKPIDAISCFLNTNIDILVLNNFVIQKDHLNL